MKTSIVFSILLVIENFCGGYQINETDSCPMTDAQWNKKKEEVTCQEGEGYFCSLNENNAFITGCLRAIPINSNVVNCPFVVTATGEVNLIHEERYTPCNITLIGCPQNNHPGYTILELYKYPLCLLRPEDRDHNITSYPDTTTKSLSTLSTVESGNTTLDNGRKDGGSINAAKIAAIIIPLVLLLAVVAYVAVNFILWKRRSPVRGLLEFAQDLVRCKTCRFGYSITSTNDDADAVELGFRLNKNDGLCDNEKEANIPLIPAPEFENDEGEEGSEEIDGSHKEHVVRPQLNPELSFYENCIQCVQEGLEETLNCFLRDELDAVNKGSTPKISSSDLKKVICKWLQNYDKPDTLVRAVDLLSRIDKTCCLENLELMPERYDISISLLLYSGRKRREKTLMYLLQHLQCIDHEDKNHQSILHYCVDIGSSKIAEKVIERDRSLLDKRNIDGRTAFNLALLSKKQNIADLLLDKGTNVQDENYYYDTVVEECLNEGWTHILRKVLNSIKRTNATDSELGAVFRKILLLYKNDYSQPVEIALEIFPNMLKNSDYYKKDHPFIWAIKVQQKDVSLFILERMNNDELYAAEDCEGFPALHVGIKYRSQVRKILEHIEDDRLLNKTDKKNNTPIMHAVRCKSKFFFSFLMKQPGVSLTNTNLDGKNVLHLVIENRWRDKCEELLKGKNSDGTNLIGKGIKKQLLREQDKAGKTALMYVISEFRDFEMMKLLLDEGSELVQTDKERKTVLHLFVSKYSEVEDSVWQRWARELLKSEKYRNATFLFQMKDNSRQTFLDIAQNIGCLHVLKTVDPRIVTEQLRQ